MADETRPDKATHKLLTPADCRCDRDHGCPICDGGLALCTVCGGAEASLPHECPGYRMTADQEDAVQAGTLDFRNGDWEAR
jgi:hypothetical protein